MAHDERGHVTNCRYLSSMARMCLLRGLPNLSQAYDLYAVDASRNALELAVMTSRMDYHQVWRDFPLLAGESFLPLWAGTSDP